MPPHPLHHTDADIVGRHDEATRPPRRAGDRGKERMPPHAHPSAAIAGAFKHAPAGMLVCCGPDHLVVAGNDAGLAMVGDGVLGRPYRIGMPNLDGQGLYEMFDQTFRTGETLTADRWRVVREPGAPTTENFYSFSTSAWREEDGCIGGVLITAVDVTQDVSAEAAQAQRYTAALDVVWALQRNLLPEGLPVLPALRLAAHYQVAGAEMQAGGDWFDVIQIDDRRVALVVGDVVGHGPAAAGAMARLSPVLNEMLSAGTDLIDAIDRLDRFAHQKPSTRAATAVVVVLEPGTGRFECATRGHAAPLICETDGSTRLVAAERGAPLGVGAGPTVSVVDDLSPGAVLLLCSDGLWERPGSTARVDRDHLAASARAAYAASSQSFPLAVDRVCQFTVEFQARTGFSDDVTLVAASRLDAAAPDLDLEAPATVERIAHFHKSVSAWLATLGVAPGESSDLSLAVYEAVANVALHAYAGQAQQTTRLEGRLRPDGCVDLVVSDRGRWQAPCSAPDGGRGLAIMRAVADTVCIDRTGDGTIVTLSSRVHHATVVGTGQLSGSTAARPAGFAVRAGDGPWPQLNVSGPVDVSTTTELRRAISAHDAGGTRPVLVDLSGVTFLSSAGVQLLYELSSEHIRLTAAPDSTAAHVLELSALSHLLQR